MGKIRDWLDEHIFIMEMAVIFSVLMLVVVLFSSVTIEESPTKTKKIKVYEYTNVVGDIVICKQIRYREPFQTLSNCNDNMTYKLMSGEVREYYINTVVDNK